MDAESKSAVKLLEGLQDAMRDVGRVWNHFTIIGTQPSQPFLVLSGRPFKIHETRVREFGGCVSLGIGVLGADARDYEMSVTILWNEDTWTITTDIWVDSDDGGQELLRKLPERTASSLTKCLEEVRAAFPELMSFDDLIPRKPST